MSKVSIAAIGRIAARSRTSSKVAAPAPRLAAAAARTWGSATATRSASPMGQTSRAFHGTSGEQRTSGGGGGAGGEGMRWGSVSVAALVAACSVAGGQALLEEAGRTDIKTAAKMLASSDPSQIIAGAHAIHKLASDHDLDDPAAASALLLSRSLVLHKDTAVQAAVLAALSSVLGYQQAAAAASKRGADSWGVLSGLAADAKAAEGVREAAAALLPELAVGGSASKGDVSLVAALMSQASVPPKVRGHAALAVQRICGREGADLAMLLTSGAPAACLAVLKDATCPSEVRTSAIKAIGSMSAFGGTWLSGAAHKNADWQGSVHAVAVAAASKQEEVGMRATALSTLTSVLAGPCGPHLSPAAATATVETLAAVLEGGDAPDLKSAALRAAEKASAVPSLLPGLSRRARPIAAEMASDSLADAVAALGACERIARSSEAAAEDIVLAHAIQTAVKAAEKHRATVDIRLAVAGLFEALAFSGSDDASMMLAHQATPIIVALVRTSDADLQVRALKILRKLASNGVNKFIMQKGFMVMHDLVPLLAREDAVQQGIALEILANMASTDNAYFGENAKALGEARALKPLMVLAKSRDSIVHRNATWALASMTACETNHVPMRACIDTLLMVIERGTPVAQRFAVMAVSNMAATDRTREILKERGAEGILRKCAHNNQSDRMLQELINKTAMGNLKRGGKQVFNIPPP